MNVNKMTLPYPVLGINDDILPRPQIQNIVERQTKSAYIFEFDVDVKNKEIIALISRGFAEYVCEVGCSKTLLRICFKQSGTHFCIEIPKQNVSGRIDFDVTITVKCQIAGYTNSGFHEDYQGFSFNLEQGDLLGFIASFSYDADIKYDKLQSVGSFMQIDKTRNPDDPTSVYLGGSKILILLPEDMFNAYKRNVSNDKKVASVIHSSLVFNALIQALYNYEENSSQLWAKTLKYRIETEPYLQQFKNNDEDSDTLFEKENIFNIAQALLGNPYHRMFECLHSISPSIDITEED